jgi:hypothetical protein
LHALPADGISGTALSGHPWATGQQRCSCFNKQLADIGGGNSSNMCLEDPESAPVPMSLRVPITGAIRSEGEEHLKFVCEGGDLLTIYYKL